MHLCWPKGSDNFEKFATLVVCVAEGYDIPCVSREVERFAEM